MSDEVLSGAAGRFAWLLGQYAHGAVGIERLLAWLDADLATLGTGRSRAIARAVRRRLAELGGATLEETRAAVLDEMVRASSPWRSDDQRACDQPPEGRAT